MCNSREMVLKNKKQTSVMFNPEVNKELSLGHYQYKDKTEIRTVYLSYTMLNFLS